MYFLKTSIIKFGSKLSQEASGNFLQKATNSLKNVALTLLIFRFKQFFYVHTVKSLHFASIPVTIIGKTNL